MFKRIGALGIFAVILVGLMLPGLALALEQPTILAPSSAVISTRNNDAVWEMWLNDLNTALLMDMDVGAELKDDEREWKNIVFESLDFPDIYFEMNLHYNELLKNVTLNDFEEDTLDDFLMLYCKSVTGRSKVYAISNDCYIVAVITQEDNVEWSHVLAIYNGWVVHALAKPSSPWAAVSDDVALFQARLITSLFQGSHFRHTSSFTLEDIAFVLNEPSGKNHLLLDYDEDGFKTVTMISPDGRMGNVHISFSKYPELEGQTLASIDDTLRKQLYSFLYLGDEAELGEMEKNMTAIKTQNGEYMLQNDEAFNYCGTVAVNGQWAMTVLCFKMGIEDEKYLTYLNDLPEQLNRLFMGENVTLPTYGTDAPKTGNDSDDTVSTYFESISLPDSDFTIYYFSDDKAMHMPLGEGAHVAVISTDTAPETIFSLFVIPAPDLHGTDIAQLTVKQQEELMQRITVNKGDIGLVGTETPMDLGYTCLRIWESVENEGYSEHLLCVCGDYLLNAMVYRMDGNKELSDFDTYYQQSILLINLLLNEYIGE